MHRTSSLLLLLAIFTLACGAEPSKGKSSAQNPAPDTPPLEQAAIARLQQKMDEIIIPSVHFENATLEQALEFLRKKSREFDKSSPPSNARGVNIVRRKTEFPDPPIISLDVKNIPLSEALRYVTELSMSIYRVESDEVIVAGLHAFEHEKFTRTFRVPPDFFSDGGSDASASHSTPSADPFATPPAPQPNPPAGKIPRKTPQQILEAAGINFPDGSSASFNPLTCLLRVTNTRPNLDLVEAYTESCCYHPASTIAFNLTIVEGPGDLIRQINAEASQTSDASKKLTKLLDLAQKPETSVKVAGHAFIETKSGQTVTTEAVSEHWLTNSIPIDLSSRIAETSGKQPSGMRLKLEPTIGADGQTIDLTLDLELSPIPSATPATDIPSQHLTSSLMIRNGITKLIGIARPPGLQQKSDATLWAVFITSARRYVENPPHYLARGTPSTATPPKGLSSITFHMPAGLFESVMEPSPKPLRDWLIEQGVTFPSGAEIHLKNNLLHVTNTQENIDSISMLIGAALQKAPKTIAITLHTVRLPSSFLPRLSQAALASTDQSKEWQEMEAAAARHEAVFLESCFFETKSGTRSTHTTAKECDILSQTPAKDKGSATISLDSQSRGSFLEIEPTLGADGRTIDVDYEHELHVTAAAPNTAPNNDQNLPQSAADIRTLKTQSRTTMHEGEIRLIALHQDLGSSHADHVWATFLQCNSVPHFSQHPRTAALAGPEADRQSMETKMYRVSADLLQRLISLETPSQEAPRDPFAIAPSPVPPRNNSVPSPFENLGVTFPEGASTAFDPKKSNLVVHNTPANHALIAAAIEKLVLAQPSTIAITTHVLQAPGPLLRRLAAQSAHKSDHRAELDELLTAAKTGTALHLDTARIETKPGTRAIVNQGHTHKTISELSLDDKGLPVFKSEPRPVGLNVELEPTTSKDSPFVDLIISVEYHTAPPLEHREHLTDTQGRRLEFPLTDFFTSKTTTGITVPSGSARLLSLCNPTGNPDLEKQDILQAIFITCDILHPDDKPTNK